jgi:homoserine dehydrogenase
MIACIGQNKIQEVRGILNGTTNYILTKMFTFGDSFESALADAQARGYAEKNPDADILGTDAARKIVILSALASGKLVPVDRIHAEGITKIRKSDVAAAEKIGCSIKLLGRCINTDGAPYILVAPFMLGADSALSGVTGGYNAVEVVAEPLGNVMFYGKGAGAGATASAVVGDLMQTMNLANACLPSFEKCDKVKEFDSFSARHYLAFDKSAEKKLEEVFGKLNFIESEDAAIITEELSESEINAKIKSIEDAGFPLLSNIRLL